MSKYSQRGSSFVFFVALTLPLTMFSLTLAADFSGIILESRKAQTVADASARAAGTAIDPTTGTFIMNTTGSAANPNCVNETSKCTTLDLAQQMYDVSVKTLIVTKAQCTAAVTVAVTKDQELTVTIPYSVTNLSFLGNLMGGKYTGFMCLTAEAKTKLCTVTDTVNCLYPGAN